eukprot:scaffold13456_cov48-Attheya_sp.AAC.4
MTSSSSDLTCVDKSKSKSMSLTTFEKGQPAEETSGFPSVLVASNTVDVRLGKNEQACQYSLLENIEELSSSPFTASDWIDGDVNIDEPSHDDMMASKAASALVESKKAKKKKKKNGDSNVTARGINREERVASIGLGHAGHGRHLRRARRRHRFLWTNTTTNSRMNDSLLAWSDEELDEESGTSNSPEVDVNMTTPLHQAARIGSGKLVRLLLAQGGDPNMRDGRNRTALHMAAGGLTGAEQQLLQAAAKECGSNVPTFESGVGIQSPRHDTQEEELDHSRNHESSDAAKATIHAAKVAGAAMGRLFKHAIGSMKVHDRKNDHLREEERPTDVNPLPLDRKELDRRIANRMDVIQALLTWNGNSTTSINSVDSRGRTGLHYSSELGRSDVCAILYSEFGILLTLVDELGRTPCELAGARGHANLAAQLEARAVLTSDPYGMDDELMASILVNETEWQEDNDEGIDEREKRRRRARHNLVAPFAWFDTWEMTQVNAEREQRIEHTLKLMKNKCKELKEEAEAQVILYSHTTEEDDDECEPNEDSSDHPENINTDDNASTASVPDPNSDTEVEDTQVEAESKDPSEEVKLWGSLYDSLNESIVAKFLTFHQWDTQKALKDFEENKEALTDAGILLATYEGGKGIEEETHTCLICCDDFSSDSPEWIQLSGCTHAFCSDCISDYIADAAQSKIGALAVVCPHHECPSFLSGQELQKLSPDKTTHDAMVESSNEIFVAACHDVRFCPHPGCSGIVKNNTLLYFGEDCFDSAGAACTAVPGSDNEFSQPITYEGVFDGGYTDVKNLRQPIKAHRFCFSCGEYEVHWPATCEVMEKWKAKIEEEIGTEAGSDTEEKGEKFEDLAHRLWLKANTRPCPKVHISYLSMTQHIIHHAHRCSLYVSSLFNVMNTYSARLRLKRMTDATTWSVAIAIASMNFGEYYLPQRCL